MLGCRSCVPYLAFELEPSRMKDVESLEWNERENEKRIDYYHDAQAKHGGLWSDCTILFLLAYQNKGH
jgi:hypothetical protein